jgi:predicted nucleic acid-binding protein
VRVGLTYDTGALLAAEAGRRQVWVLHEQAMNERVRPTVPAAVLAQAWRGGPQPLLSRLLRGCTVEALTEQAARAAGAALAASRASDVVDAMVVVAAVGRQDTVVTTDPNDLRRIAGAIGARIDLEVL